MQADKNPGKKPAKPVTPTKTKGSVSTRRDLERYTKLFADRTQVMKSSAMRDLMAITEDSDIISLAGGLPDTSSFPSSIFTQTMQSIAHERTAAALQYGPTEGLSVLHDAITAVMQAEGVTPQRDQTLITTGGQQVIDLVCKTLINPGDIIIAEAPTYPGAIPAFCAYQADIRQIPVDQDGMDVEQLEVLLSQLSKEDRKPKFIYTVPNFQNPSGVTLSLKRRERLVQIAQEHEILILEDNPYGLLRYENDPLPTLLSLDRGQYVIYLGTFSKILSPGIRVGWTVAPAPILAKMNLGKQSADLCSSSLTQLFVSEYFRDHDWRAYVNALITTYRQRRDVMLKALKEHFPAESSWTTPEGGLFVWVTLPEFIDTTDLLARALRAGVAFVPGRAAYSSDLGASSMRLNFSGQEEEEIREGIRRIGETIEEQLDLYDALTGKTRRPGTKTQPEETDPEKIAKILHLPKKRAR